MRQYANRRDSNEADIAQALLCAGATVQKLSVPGVPDLLVGYHGVNYLMEVKEKRGKLTEAEVDWHFKWDGAVAIVRTINDALIAIGAME